MANTVKSVRGLTIKQPSSLDFENYNLTKSGRVASGSMTIELIAQKRKFLLRYDVISGPELDVIRSAIYSSDHMFFDFVYVENGQEKSATVYSGALKYSRFRTDGSVSYWKGLSFDLIEK